MKITEKQTPIDDTPDSLLNAILEKDKQLKRLLHEKEMLLSRLINIPQDKIKDTPGHVTKSRHLFARIHVSFVFPADRLDTLGHAQLVSRSDHLCCQLP